MQWFSVVQVFVSIMMPICLGCISWLALAAIESKTSSAVLNTRVSNLETHDIEVLKSLLSLQARMAETSMDGKRIEEKIESVGKVILERMEGLAYRLELVEKAK